MAVLRGKALLKQENPDPKEIAKSITDLTSGADHIRKGIRTGLRDYDSGQEAIDEISKNYSTIRTKIMQHHLVFTMPLGNSQSLITGSLKLTYPNGQVIDYLATSGLPDFQRSTDQWARGKGPIPQGDDYQIPSEPYFLETRGVEGLFFHITPDPVGLGNHIRSELGIHYDANVPGTSGCIGIINWDGWQGFCRRMRNIAALGIKTLPLKVEY